MLRRLMGIFVGKLICESSTWQQIQSLKITILGANWQVFSIKRIAKCSYLSRVIEGQHCTVLEGTE